MSAKPVLITSVCRTTASGETDTLDLKPGVNVIVGLKDTGKSGWLQTISYLLGDTDPPEKALGPTLAAKFDAATLQMTVGGEPVTLQRRWKEKGAKHKVFVNGDGINSDDFSEAFLTRLGVPVVHFPKGNPYSGATWPELSWRMLFRHVYREERFWADIADKQPEKEQHACLLQFLGVADKLYPKELGEDIDRRKELLRLQARKEQFEEVLQQTAAEIIPDPAVGNAPTADAIEQGVARLRAEIDQNRSRRDAALAALLQVQAGPRPELADTGLGERRVRLSSEREQERGRLAEVERRIAELAAYRGQVKAERNRLGRVETAGKLLADLKVTCCPYCDQKVAPGTEPVGHCYVCRQPMPERGPDELAGAKKRLAFEAEQLEGEEAELADLLGKLGREREQIVGNLRRADEELAEVETLLRPVRAAIASVIPPEITILDTQAGQLEERIAQLQRLRRVIDLRADLARQIDDLRAKIQTLTGDLDAKSATIPYEQLSDVMTDGIKEYIGQLAAGDPARWPHQPIRFELGERGFKLLVGKVPWTTLGATSIGYVALGYHHALLKLTGQDGYNYPGLALIDFPMTLADKTTIADKENYLIEPLVALAERNPNVQVIVCGRAFQRLKGANRIELSHVWQQGESDPGATEEPASADDRPPDDPK